MSGEYQHTGGVKPDKPFQMAVGSFRGVVVDRDDPLKIGMLKVRVINIHRDIPTEQLPWAWPKFAGAGSKNTGFITIPPLGATVWVTFEMGDLDFPVWESGWYGAPSGSGELPSQHVHGKGPLGDKDLSPNSELWAASASGGFRYIKLDDRTDKQETVIKTPSGHTIKMVDKDGEERIEIYDKAGNIIKLDSANKKLELFMDGDITASASGDVKVSAGKNADISAGGDLSATASGSVSVTSEKNATVSAIGNVTVTSEGDVNASAAGNIGANAGMNVGVSARGMLTGTVYGMTKIDCYGMIMVRGAIIMLN
jgi:hypothetical protein